MIPVPIPGRMFPGHEPFFPVVGEKPPKGAVYWAPGGARWADGRDEVFREQDQKYYWTRPAQKLTSVEAPAAPTASEHGPIPDGYERCETPAYTDEVPVGAKFWSSEGEWVASPFNPGEHVTVRQTTFWIRPRLPESLYIEEREQAYKSIPEDALHFVPAPEDVVQQGDRYWKMGGWVYAQVGLRFKQIQHSQDLTWVRSKPPQASPVAVYGPLPEGYEVFHPRDGDAQKVGDKFWDADGGRWGSRHGLYYRHADEPIPHCRPVSAGTGRNPCCEVGPPSSELSEGPPPLLDSQAVWREKLQRYGFPTETPPDLQAVQRFQKGLERCSRNVAVQNMWSDDPSDSI